LFTARNLSIFSVAHLGNNLVTCGIPRRNGFDRELIKPDGSDAQVEKNLRKSQKRAYGRLACRVNRGKDSVLPQARLAGRLGRLPGMLSNELHATTSLRRPSGGPNSTENTLNRKISHAGPGVRAETASSMKNANVV
jgi:hypothetical protein